MKRAWHRLIGYLARGLIAEATAAARAEAQRAHAERLPELLHTARMAGFAAGQLQGQQHTFDELMRVVNDRTAGIGDYVTAEDIERAKRGMVH